MLALVATLLGFNGPSVWLATASPVRVPTAVMQAPMVDKFLYKSAGANAKPMGYGKSDFDTIKPAKSVIGPAFLYSRDPLIDGKAFEAGKAYTHEVSTAVPSGRVVPTRDALINGKAFEAGKAYNEPNAVAA